MSEPPEDPIATAERHVGIGEALVARQLAVIDELDRDNHLEAAARGRKLLVALQRSLDLAREHLRVERDRQRAGAKLPGAASES
ncbi:hypothetical protein JMJ56_27140 [Belnapia sp. T18]|uniref:Uncharacterized protein n=1 Tax=Belnapia arida TaxID=2804533 RepID=A0ABS1UCJ1_9PROT|nr:hypothetical protein [Belnapia arida]MBL6081669.1 hypothetical protein [Belnapia arida]